MTNTALGSPTVLAGALSVTDSEVMEHADVKVAVNYQSGEDTLSYNAAMLPAGVTTSGFNAATGDLGFTGPASASAYQALLQSVTFADGAANPNVHFSSRSVTFTVVDDLYSSDTEEMSVNVVAEQSITFLGPLNPVTYGVSPVTLAATSDSGLPVSYSIDPSSTGTGSINGNQLTITGAGTIVIDANQAGNADYLAAPQVQQSLVVKPKVLVITGLTATDKTYDGTTADPLNGTAGLLAPESPGSGSTSDGIPYAGDSVSLVSTSASAFNGSFASPDAANSIAVSVTGGALTGPQAGDYILSTTNEQSGLSANIGQATLTVTGVTAINKPYDGTENATLNTSGAALNGVAAGDTGVQLDAASGTGTFASPDVANNIAVQVSGLSLTGTTQDGTAASVDYTLTQPTTSANIGLAILTVSDITAATKTYDGTDNATLNTSAATLNGVAAGDTGVTFNVSGAMGQFASPDAGHNITVDISGITFGGTTQDGTAANVDYRLVQPITSANIGQATLTVTGITANGKTYDGTDNATLNSNGAVLNGVIAADTGVGLSTAGATGTFASPDVANNIAVQVSGLSLTGTTQDGTAASADYTLVQPTASANIGLATVTITGITADNKTYDGTETATLNTSGAVINGVAAGDTGVSLDAAGSTGTFASPDVANNIAVQVSGLSLTGTTQDGTAASVDYTLVQPATSANISPATLAVTGITASNKTYDGTETATINTSGAALNGVAAGDTGVTFNVAGATGHFVSPDAGNSVTVAIAGVTFGGTTQDGTAASVDYTLAQPTTSANIGQATLTVTGVTANSKTYDGTENATADATGAVLNGVIAADTGVGLDTASAAGTFASPDVANNIAVQVNGLSLTGTTQDGTAASVDYTLVQPTSSASIGQATLTVTGITASNKTYDGTETAALNTSGAALSGVAVGDTGVGLSTAGATGTFASPDVANNIAVQVSGLSLTGTTQDGTAAGVDYTLTQPATSANISQATLTVTGLTVNDKTYDGTTNATINTSRAALSGVVAGDTGVWYYLAGITGQFVSPDAGLDLTVDISGIVFGGITQDGTAANVDYQLVQPTGNANIVPAAVTVTGITASNKTYDGTTNATINTSGATLNGVIAADTGVGLSTAGAAGAFASPDAANNIAVQVSGLSLTGTTQDGTAASADYVLVQPTTSANISPVTLTVTGITAANKTYDGTETATLDTSAAALNGVVATDTGVGLSAAGAFGTFASPNVANNITVQVSGLSLTGTTEDGTAAGIDYALTQPTPSASINPKPLFVTGLSALNKTYDGTIAATLIGTASLLAPEGAGSGSATDGQPYAGDIVNLASPAASAFTGAFVSPNGGTGIVVDVTGNALTGAQAGNYVLSGSDEENGAVTANITPANQSINFTPLAPITFGTPSVTLSASASSGLPVAFSVVSGPGSITGNTLTVTGAGNILVAANQAGNSNYSAAATVEQFQVVDPAPQTISFPPLSSVTYGVGTVNLTGAATTTSPLPISYSVLAGPGTLNGNTLTVTGAGAIVIEASQNGNANWSAATPVTQTLTVSPASLTVTASDETKIFGQSDPALAFTYTGLVNGDQSATFTGALSRDVGESASTYAIGQGTLAATGNYTIGTFNAGTFSINAASQTVNFGPLSPVTYGVSPITLDATIGSDSPAASPFAVVYSVVSGSGTINGDTLTVTGAGNIVIQAAASGSNANWTPATPVQQTLVVTPAPLTVLATNESKVFDNSAATDPALAYTYTGLVNGDSSASFTGSLSRAGGEAVGSYAISQGTLAATGNYTVAGFVPGTFNITPAGQTITFNTPAAVTYGTAAFAIDAYASASSGLPVSYTIVSGPGTLNGDTLTVTGAGSIVIEASQAGNADYSAATPVTETLTVNPASLTVTADNASKLFTQSDPAFTYTYTGLVNGDLAADFTGSLTRSNASTNTAGVYDGVIVQGTLAATGNYTIGTFNAGNFTINQETPTLSFAAPTSPVTYSPGMTITLSATSNSPAPVTFAILGSSTGAGTIGGTSTVGDTTTATLTVTTAGTLVVQASQGADTNWTAATPQQQTLVVQKAEDTITFPPLPVEPLTATPITLNATGGGSSSPVVYAVLLGPGRISGDKLTATAVGTILVQATQAGDANYQSATPVLQSVEIEKAQTITFTQPASPVSYRATPIALSAVSSSALAVSFSIVGGTGAGTISGDKLTVTRAGSFVIEADQAGNATYAAAVPVQRTLVVNKASQTITFAALAAVTYGHAPITLDATASSGLPVTYSVVSGPGTLSGNQLTISGAGAIVVEATQAGNANYNVAATVKQTLTVHQATLTVAADNTTWHAGTAGQQLAGFTISGFVDGDTQSSLFGTEAPLLSCPTVNQNDPVVGSYAIVVSQGTLATPADYKLVFKNGTLLVH